MRFHFRIFLINNLFWSRSGTDIMNEIIIRIVVLTTFIVVYEVAVFNHSWQRNNVFIVFLCYFYTSRLASSLKLIGLMHCEKVCWWCSWKFSAYIWQFSKYMYGSIKFIFDSIKNKSDSKKYTLIHWNIILIFWNILFDSKKYKFVSIPSNILLIRWNLRFIH